MNILYLLVPLALLLAGVGVYAFYWSVKSGQYDDTDTPALRVLMEDELAAPPTASRKVQPESPPEATPSNGKQFS